MSGIKIVKSFEGDDEDYSNQKSRGAHRNMSYNPKAGKGKKRQPRQNDPRRYANVTSWRDTLNFCVSPFTPDYPGKAILYHTENFKSLIDKVSPRHKDMKVKVVNADTLDTAKVELDNKSTTSDKIMALNMASKYKPGGGVKSGSHAQEEVIARRSNLMLLLPEPLYDNEIQRDQVILTRNIMVIKDQNEEYLPSDQMYTVNLLACAAVKKPKTKKDAEGEEIYGMPIFREIMKEKINNIFQVAYVQGYDTLVLGALGCGAYGNPHGEVTQIFLDCLERYRNCFKKVIFAVYSTRDDNYEWFKQCLEKPYKDRTALLEKKEQKQ